MTPGGSHGSTLVDIASLPSLLRAYFAKSLLHFFSSVAVSGLISFVGIVVPHLIRLTLGSSYYIIVPLSVFLGGAFLKISPKFQHAP